MTGQRWYRFDTIAFIHGNVTVYENYYFDEDGNFMQTNSAFLYNDSIYYLWFSRVDS
mgnify:CR=1 FL=1